MSRQYFKILSFKSSQLKYEDDKCMIFLKKYEKSSDNTDTSENEDLDQIESEDVVNDNKGQVYLSRKVMGTINYSLDMRQLERYCRTKYKKVLPKGELKDTSELQAEKNAKELKDIAEGISDKNKEEVTSFLGFTPAIISMRIVGEHREKLYQNGFELTYEGETYKYVRYKRSASNARHGQCLFIIDVKDSNGITLRDRMFEWGNCSLKMPETNPASWEAYTALTLSGIEEELLQIDKNQILLIRDMNSVFDDAEGSVNIHYRKRIWLDENLDGKEETVLGVFNPDSDYKYERETYHNREKAYKELNESGKFRVTNKIWDGESLLDDSVFKESSNYKDASFVLLRARLFKSCAFRTNLQKWFSDNGISPDDNPKDKLNGVTTAKRVSDIKLVITESSLKYLKLCDEYNGDKCSDAQLKKLLKGWLSGNTGDGGSKACEFINFGVVKTDHRASLYRNTSYQFLNTIGLTKDEVKKLVEPQIKKINRYKKDPKAFAAYLDMILKRENGDSDEMPDEDDILTDMLTQSRGYSSFSYQVRSIRRLIELSDECASLEIYKDFLYAQTKSMEERLIRGEVSIEAVFATLFGNPAEFLYATLKTSSKYNPDKDKELHYKCNGQDRIIKTLKDNEIYCTRYENDQLLCGARYPHVTMGNLFVTKNVNEGEKSFYETYFHLCPEIVCINSIGHNILQRLNGADFDSDIMMLTKNPIIVNAANRQKDFFRVPVNGLDESLVESNKALSSDAKGLADLDNRLSGKDLGEIINIASYMNGEFWRRYPIESWKIHDKTGKLVPIYGQLSKDDEYGPMPLIGEPAALYDTICKLAILSGAVIDSAKKSTSFKASKEKDAARNQKTSSRIIESNDDYFVNHPLSCEMKNGHYVYDDVPDEELPFVMQEEPRYYTEGILKKENKHHEYSKVPTVRKKKGNIEVYKYNYMIGKLSEQAVYYIVMKDFCDAYGKKDATIDKYVKEHTGLDSEELKTIKRQISDSGKYRDILDAIELMNREEYVDYITETKRIVSDTVTKVCERLKINIPALNPEMFDFTGKRINEMFRSDISYDYMSKQDYEYKFYKDTEGSEFIFNQDEFYLDNRSRSYKPVSALDQHCTMSYIYDLVTQEKERKINVSGKKFAELFTEPEEILSKNEHDKKYYIIELVKNAQKKIRGINAEARKNGESKHNEIEEVVSLLRASIRKQFSGEIEHRDKLTYELIKLTSDKKASQFKALLSAMVLDEQVLTDEVKERLL